jgi:restriction system protein
MLPLLKVSSDKKEHSSKEAVELLAESFHLSDEERRRLLPSGKLRVFYDRVHWALSYLKGAGLLVATRRGYFRISDRGVSILEQNPPRIDVKFLRQFPEFLDYVGASKSEKNSAASEPKSAEDTLVATRKTPEEVLDESYFVIRKDLSQELLTQVKGCTPEFFERLVVELLVGMGYGGSIAEAGRAIGKTGDEGIDGIIKEDQLGLDAIYIQAKKWEGSVGRPEIQKFAGALQGRRARKGIFITTGSFSEEARRYVEMIDSKIVLIDGQQLAEYMIDNNIGVSIEKEYQIKKINSDYFVEL